MVRRVRSAGSYLCLKSKGCKLEVEGVELVEKELRDCSPMVK